MEGESKELHTKACAMDLPSAVVAIILTDGL